MSGLAIALIAASGAPALDCAHPERMDQATLTFCAGSDFERADAALNAEWKRTAAKAKQRDAQVDRTYDRQPGWFDTLLAGQRAWLAFREAQCTLQGFDARGGSMQPMLENGCKAQMTEQRTRQLHSLLTED